MKIAQFSDSYKPQINGVVSAMLALNKAYVKERHEVHVFAPGNKNRDAKIEGVYEHYYKSFGFFLYKGYYAAPPIIPSIDWIFTDKDFDIIHTHSPYPIGLNARRIAKKKKIPIVATFHTSYPDYVRFLMGPAAAFIINPFLESYLRWYHNGCDAVTCPSDHTKKVLEGYGIKNVHVCPNGISLKRFHPNQNKAHFRKKYRIGKEPFLLFLGRISYEKNIEFLIKNARKINSKIIISGDGPALNYMKTLVNREGVSDRVKFLGFLPKEEISECYSAADVFCTPSFSETQGLTVLEAMACKTPAVVFNTATAEKVTHKKDGYVANTNEEFIDYANKLLADTKLRKRMGEAALKVAKKNSLESFGSRMTKIYRKVI